jgi:hypothetical protein
VLGSSTAVAASRTARAVACSSSPSPLLLRNGSGKQGVRRRGQQMMNILRIRDIKTSRTGSMTWRCGCKTSRDGRVGWKALYISLNLNQFNPLRCPPMLYNSVSELISSLSFLSRLQMSCILYLISSWQRHINDSPLDRARRAPVRLSIHPSIHPSINHPTRRRNHNCHCPCTSSSELPSRNSTGSLQQHMQSLHLNLDFLF